MYMREDGSGCKFSFSFFFVFFKTVFVCNVPLVNIFSPKKKSLNLLIYFNTYFAKKKKSEYSKLYSNSHGRKISITKTFDEFIYFRETKIHIVLDKQKK